MVKRHAARYDHGQRGVRRVAETRAEERVEQEVLHAGGEQLPAVLVARDQVAAAAETELIERLDRVHAEQGQRRGARRRQAQHRPFADNARAHQIDAAQHQQHRAEHERRAAARQQQRGHEYRRAQQVVLLQPRQIKRHRQRREQDRRGEVAVAQIERGTALDELLPVFGVGHRHHEHHTPAQRAENLCEADLQVICTVLAQLRAEQDIHAQHTHAEPQHVIQRQRVGVLIPADDAAAAEDRRRGDENQAPRARPETQLHGPCRQVQHERGHERDQQEHARQEAAEVFIFRCREQEDHAERRNRGDQIRAERQKPAREQTEHNHTEHRLTRGQRRQHHQKQQREVPAAVPQLHRPVGKAGKQALAACEQQVGLICCQMKM